MFDQRSLDDYVDVAERITEFYDRYPEGCLRAADPGKPWELAIVTGTRKDGTETTQTFIVVVAAAYRMPGDLAPGMGMAWEVFPGRTPYTLGSELMNAETSAWGRAMAALGIATKRGVASRQEVAARRAERDDGLPVNRDGSLSRSRTTDEEKDGAGVMTSGQHAEHSALQPKRAEQPPAERLRSVPADDEWYAPPPDERDYDSPRTITPRQNAGMRAAFAALGVTDRAKRLKVTGDVLGRPVGSSTELSRHEAGLLLEALADQQRKGKEART